MLSRFVGDPRPTLLIEPNNRRAVLLPVDEYERLRDVYDWHQRMLRGA
jgi:PHD/YefM family antitoxin component YafN of YafNO toxin-antitoxin module